MVLRLTRNRKIERFCCVANAVRAIRFPQGYPGSIPGLGVFIICNSYQNPNLAPILTAISLTGLNNPSGKKVSR